MKNLKIAESEWLALGEGLFGKDKSKWQFMCPSCGTVQTMKEFAIISAKYEIHTTAVMTVCKNYLLAEDKSKAPCNFNTIDNRHPYLFFVGRQDRGFNVVFPFKLDPRVLKKLSGRTS